MEADVRAGLGGCPKSIPPVWFYDEAGSRLFEQITRLPEYYLTRAERSILAERAAEIVARSGARTLVEIGSGTSEKTGLLLDAMAAAGHLQRVMLLDISEEVLREAAGQLAGRYGVEVQAVVGDLRHHLDRLQPGSPALWAFLGSTVGNFEPPARASLLAGFGRAMAPGDGFLIGTDLVKDPGRLVAAYDDSSGVTAAFNLNVLSVLNATFGGDFDLSSFDHRAVWNSRDRWMQMSLRSRRPQSARLATLGLEVELAGGEEILTEISAKFEAAQVGEELGAAGLSARWSWTDRDGDFLLSLATR
jgi:L-histidine N-alpha-methyltransferase